MGYKEKKRYRER